MIGKNNKVSGVAAVNGWKAVRPVWEVSGWEERFVTEKGEVL